jgi:HSP20 family protein
MLPTLVKEPRKRALGTLRNDIDQLFEDFFHEGFGLMPKWPAVPWKEGDWFVPALDVKENEDSFVFEVELPGKKAEDVKVEVTDGVLSIRGERARKHDERTKSWHRTERSYGCFERRLALPNSADYGKVDATFENGVLMVTVGKTAAAKPTSVKVKVK